MKKLVRDVTCVEDLDKPYIEKIADSAEKIFRELREDNSHKFANNLTGEKCVLLFSQESTRTFDSFWDTFGLLGAERIAGFRNAKESAINKGESIFHTVETYLGQGTGAKFIVMRNGFEGSARWAMISAFRAFAKKVRQHTKEYRSFPQNLILPIIFNGGDGQHNHPSQLLLDCATIKHKLDRITDINFGECNDLGSSRVVSSHIDAASILNWKMSFCPLPDDKSQLNLRQRFNLAKSEISYSEHIGIKDMLKMIDLLYVSRCQFNLRGEKTGAHAAKIFDAEHPRISLKLIKPYNIPVFHARPIDKNAQEITPDLYDHPLDYSGIQSDFGVPTRMAMCMYALDNRLFSLPGIISSLKPEEIGFIKKNLSNKPAKIIENERFTTSMLNHGFVIDHIPLGCGGVMASLISKFCPDIQVVLAINVKGDYPNSIPKDVIKLHVPENFIWPREIDNIVALFSDYTAKKSCRVSQFVNHNRTHKWCYRIISDNGERCNNKNCVTNPDHNEEIHFCHQRQTFQGQEIKVCPFCGNPQITPELIDLFTTK